VEMAEPGWWKIAMVVNNLVIGSGYLFALGGENFLQ
jgi:hypothetical protein